MVGKEWPLVPLLAQEDPDNDYTEYVVNHQLVARFSWTDNTTTHEDSNRSFLEINAEMNKRGFNEILADTRKIWETNGLQNLQLLINPPPQPPYAYFQLLTLLFKK